MTAWIRAASGFATVLSPARILGSFMSPGTAPPIPAIPHRTAMWAAAFRAFSTLTPKLLNPMSIPKPAGMSEW
eukprot:CAMPEP_0114151280 /NCGR_PEP_ID=MMETSP0043_2-20121206/23169_2 /TAXON_ID=464988 /ORGANISM="Hemiselmis andersenii, Strain CCMP644" /LENGTH=72 /DNA_ID=CAMNT_0001246101 /DNA_START=306 /DNA_END=521 /DNA_ORIENTATION=-